MNEYLTEKYVKEMVDTRELAKINDECAAKWNADEDYHFFNVQRLSNNKLGLIKDNQELDLDDAYHAVVISN
jgi:hypothetical protein